MVGLRDQTECVCVCVLRLGVLSKNTHTWCVSSSRANRWEERTSKLVAPIWEGRMTEDLCLFLIQSFFSCFFFLLRSASHAEHT